jgi:hypothetical protein
MHGGGITLVGRVVVVVVVVVVGRLLLLMMRMMRMLPMGDDDPPLDDGGRVTGYFWGDAGCVYFGGKLWEDPANDMKLRYSNGRWRHNTRKWPHGDNANAWHNVTNQRSWLCEKGFASWGNRIDIHTYECHDCSRSAVLFGESSVVHAFIQGTTNNDPYDMEIQGRQGFGFYDINVKTMLVNITFKKYQPKRKEVQWRRNSVIVDLTHSDIFKPTNINAVRNLRMINADYSTIVRRWVRDTGASRFFNIIDWDGTLVQSQTCGTYIISSELPWWDVGDNCFHRTDAYICPQVPGRDVVAIDMDLGSLHKDKQYDFYPSEDLTQAQRDLVYIGHTSQFGANSFRRSIITTNKHVMTGPSGLGWVVLLVIDDAAGAVLDASTNFEFHFSLEDVV